MYLEAQARPTPHAITRPRLRPGTHRARILRNAHIVAAAQRESTGAAKAIVEVVAIADHARRVARAGHTVGRAATTARQRPAAVWDRVRGSGAAGGCARGVVVAQSSTWRGIGGTGVGHLGHRLVRLWFGVTMWVRSSAVRRTASGSFALATMEGACAPALDPWLVPCFGWVKAALHPAQQILTL